mmetsp:Transcript_61647/g.198589  ORF Transcript_61647/g.198589 Transcript_61647/m.198589 type:complete len:230 (-) Transcript_61647:1090-1779(-)
MPQNLGCSSSNSIRAPCCSSGGVCCQESVVAASRAIGSCPVLLEVLRQARCMGGRARGGRRLGTPAPLAALETRQEDLGQHRDAAQERGVARAPARARVGGQGSRLQHGQHRHADQHAYWPPNEAKVAQPKDDPDGVDAHLLVSLNELYLKNVRKDELQQQLAHQGLCQHQEGMLVASVQKDNGNRHCHGYEGTNLRHIVKEERYDPEEHRQVDVQRHKEQGDAEAIEE